jgi:hypothetical protein
MSTPIQSDRNETVSTNTNTTAPTGGAPSTHAAPTRRWSFWPMLQGNNAIVVALLAFVFCPELSLCGAAPTAPEPSRPGIHELAAARPPSRAALEQRFA